MLKKALAAAGLGFSAYVIYEYYKKDNGAVAVNDNEGGAFLRTALEVVNEVKNEIILNPNASMTPSLRIMNLLKTIEQFAAVPYLAQEGQMTVGYGHVILKNESFNTALTKADADQLFVNDLNKHIEPILKQVSVALTQYQFDALVSFVFNVGHVGYDMADYINDGDMSKAADEFMKFAGYFKRKNGKKVGERLISGGLYRRRANEMAIFRNGVYPNDLRDL
jgi:lysozyme